MTINGKTLGENIQGHESHNSDVIRSFDNPIAHTALAVVRGNIAPRGAMIKPSAASAKLMKHRGKALVWNSAVEMDAVIHSDDLEVDENSVLILRNIGPQGAPGMPEWGMMPVPRKLLKQGIRDVVRISDARMSGTAFGTCVLHVTPEAAIGGPLGLIRDGDWIELDVENRSIHLDVAEEELERRKAEWKAPERHYERGYGSMFLDHILQADEGCDFDFLRAGAEIPDPQIR
jgi:dihydroxy-acid dehydratase